VDFLVHATGAQQRRVQFVDVIRGEDDDALASAAGPESVCEIEHA